MRLALNGLSLELQIGFYSLIYIQLIMQPKQFEETRLSSPSRAATHTVWWFNTDSWKVMTALSQCQKLTFL